MTIIRLTSVLAVFFFLSLAVLAQAEEWDSFGYRSFWEEATPSQVRECLSKGADPNEKFMDRETALHYAASYSDDPEVVKVLINAGADLYARTGGGVGGATPLHWAVWNNRSPSVAAVVQVLLDAGADIAARDNFGDSPFDWIHDESPLIGTELYWTLRRYGSE